MEKTDYRDFALMCPCGHEAEIEQRQVGVNFNYWVECPECGRKGSRCYSRSRAVIMWNKGIPKDKRNDRIQKLIAKINRKAELRLLVHEYCAIIRSQVNCRDCPLNDSPACVEENPTLLQLECAIDTCRELYGELEEE